MYRSTWTMDSLSNFIVSAGKCNHIMRNFKLNIAGVLLSASAAMSVAAGPAHAATTQTFAATTAKLTSVAMPAPTVPTPPAPDGGVSTGGGGGSNIYSRWANVPHSPNFFPIAVWWQAAQVGGRHGAYSSLAAAVAGEKMNILLGMSGTSGGGVSWPEFYGRDNGEMEAIKANNLYVVGGIFTPTAQDTGSGSVASMLALARTIGASSNLIGYNEGDEPDCAQAAAEPAQVAALAAIDPTRMVTYNENHCTTQPAYANCLSTVTGPCDPQAWRRPTYTL